LLLVVTLIGILVTIVVTRIMSSSNAARIKACNHNRTQINSALERYAINNGALATAIGDVDAVDYFPEGIPVCPFDGSTYLLNGTNYRVDGHNH
jgi:type II secretory pathway pseudopilin PulG